MDIECVSASFSVKFTVIAERILKASSLTTAYLENAKDG